MTKPTIQSPIVNALYEAHVAYMLQLLTGDGLIAHLGLELDANLANAKKLKLGKVVTREQIKATARLYTADMPITGGVPELVGDVARLLHAHPIHDDTRLCDILSDYQVKEIVNKVVELREFREQLIHAVLGNPLLVEMSSDLISRGIKGYLAQGNAAAKNIPGASALMGIGKSVLSKASPGIEKTLDDYVRKTTAVTLRHSEETLKAKLSDDRLRTMAMDLWVDIKEWEVGRFRKFVHEDHLEEIFVVGYEFWRAELRQSTYYHTVIDVAIDGFFDKYEHATLHELLDEVGVSREIIMGEFERFAPSVIKVLHKAKMLDGIVRRQLLPFYASGHVEAALAQFGVTP